jgi:hypothetical protein
MNELQKFTCYRSSAQEKSFYFDAPILLIYNYFIGRVGRLLK